MPQWALEVSAFQLIKQAMRRACELRALSRHCAGRFVNNNTNWRFTNRILIGFRLDLEAWNPIS